MAEQANVSNVNPLGAGDLIDRAIRLYRKNFWTLIKIALPPILISAFGSMLLSIGWREALLTSKDLAAAGYISMIIGGVFLWALGTLMTLMVMGGASRNLVRHLLWGEAITFRETYGNTLSRFFGLLMASFIISLILYFTAFILFYILMIVVGLAIVAATASMPVTGPVGPVLGTLVSLAATAGTVWLFFLVASRFAYTPQIMLVEGQGVFPAMGRSISLAGGNVRRLIALVFFTLFVVLSALSILLVPLMWYASLSGVELFTLDPDVMPMWYLIGWQVVWQLSWVLLTPVLMIGLSLLYVDERVRHEGYDIELMAARQLGEIPSLPKQFLNPLHPALAAQTSMAPVQPGVTAAAAAERRPPSSTLGLN